MTLLFSMTDMFSGDDAILYKIRFLPSRRMETERWGMPWQSEQGPRPRSAGPEEGEPGGSNLKDEWT